MAAMLVRFTSSSPSLAESTAIFTTVRHSFQSVSFACVVVALLGHGQLFLRCFGWGCHQLLGRNVSLRGPAHFFFCLFVKPMKIREIDMILITISDKTFIQSQAAEKQTSPRYERRAATYFVFMGFRCSRVCVHVNAVDHGSWRQNVLMFAITK